jgi:hypothetical protein
MRRIFTFALLGAAVGSAQADMLWDQFTFFGPNEAISDQEYTDFPNSSFYTVSDVTVGSGGWNVTSVSTLVSIGVTLETWNASVTQARLHVFSKTGALPLASDSPAASTLVSITTGVLGAEREIVASGLNIDLSEGSYWIGLTPIASSSLSIAYHFHSASNVGDPSAIRNPAGGAGFGTNWGTLGLIGQPVNDLTLRINGTTLVPEPATLAIFGIGALAMLKRRKRADRNSH